MKAEDLKTKTIDELNKLLLDKKKEQFNQRFQFAQGQLEKTHEMKETRKTIARIKTFITQKKKDEAAKGKKAA